MIDNNSSRYNNEITRSFAERIKNHMIKYCNGRLDQQYCAIEIIDYIGQLLGESNFAIDVDKEINEHDDKLLIAFATWFARCGRVSEPVFDDTVRRWIEDFKADCSRQREEDRNADKLI